MPDSQVECRSLRRPHFVLCDCTSFRIRGNAIVTGGCEAERAAGGSLLAGPVLAARRRTPSGRVKLRETEIDGWDLTSTTNRREAGKKYGAPDFRRRAFFRAVVDGRYKLVRWFSPE